MSRFKNHGGTGGDLSWDWVAGMVCCGVGCPIFGLGWAGGLHGGCALEGTAPSVMNEL